MSVIPESHDAMATGSGRQVTVGGIAYPAEEIARGAACEVFSAEPADGFVRDGRVSARLPYRRVVHVSEVEAVDGEARSVTTASLTCHTRSARRATPGHRRGSIHGCRGNAQPVR